MYAIFLQKHKKAHTPSYTTDQTTQQRVVATHMLRIKIRAEHPAERIQRPKPLNNINASGLSGSEE